MCAAVVCGGIQGSRVPSPRRDLGLSSWLQAQLGISLQSVLKQRQSPGDGGEEAQPPSILSYLAACDFHVPGRNKPHNPAETSEGDSFSSEDQKGAESRSTTPALDHRMLPLVIIQETGAEEPQHPLPDHSTLDILKKTPCGDGFPRSPSRHKGRRDSFSQARAGRLAEQENISQESWKAAELRADGRARSMDRTLQELLHLLNPRHEGPAQLQKLEGQVSCLRDKLKVGGSHCRVPLRPAERLCPALGSGHSVVVAWSGNPQTGQGDPKKVREIPKGTGSPGFWPAEAGRDSGSSPGSSPG